MEHALVAGEPGKFAGWPANNGVWTWDGREILVGFSYGDYEEKQGHNIVNSTIRSLLSRSLDGGMTWKMEEPGNFVGQGQTPSESPGGIDFAHPDFAMRLVGEGYHGSIDAKGAFFFSYDRGRNWRGPFRFGKLMEHPELKNLRCTARTNYLVQGSKECLLFLSGKRDEKGMVDRAFLASTRDGGATFQFVSWIVSYQDPNRAVMPSPARCTSGKLVAALRRRASPDDRCWVDLYSSGDEGLTWSFLSKVGDTGHQNGNPPALARLADGRLCCVFGNRARRVMIARVSGDEGKSWGDEIILRDNFVQDKFGDDDFGYPRLVQRNDGRLVAMYYWATKERPHQHIAATIFTP